MAQGLLTFPDLMKVFLAVNMASQAVGSAATWGPDKSKAEAGTRSIMALVDAGEASPIDPLAPVAPADSVSVPAKNAPPPAGPGRLVFEGVHFAYPTRTDRPALSDFSLVIEPGQVSRYHDCHEIRTQEELIHAIHYAVQRNKEHESGSPRLPV